MGLAVRHRDVDDGDLRVRDELRGELGEVLGDEEDDVVLLLDLREERPAVERDDGGAVEVPLERRVPRRGDRLGVLDDDAHLARRDEEPFQPPEGLLALSLIHI